MSQGCICIKPEIISGVNTCLIGDTSLNLENDIHFVWGFEGSYIVHTLNPFMITVS